MHNGIWGDDVLSHLEMGMVTIKKCKCAACKAKHQNRLELRIGHAIYHITREEARRLRAQLERFKL